MEANLKNKLAGFDYYQSPAKINLLLRVLSQRSDGYHELQTVFRFLDFHDLVGFRINTDSENIRLLYQHREIDPQTDLIFRAAKALQDRSGCSMGADIDLIKKIPIGGGLGGGSSNAATTLIALNALWDTRLSREELQSLALHLGADVPVFIFGQTAFAEGVGERFTPLKVRPCGYLVVTPRSGVATKSVFSDPQLTRNSKPIKIADFSSFEGQNDLETTVCRLFPEVRRALDFLRAYGPACLSGSGSSVFCRLEEGRDARAVLDALPDGFSGFVARGLDRHPLWGLTPD
ncbi:MAG: 4-(cytidine 5'-diphospho)-2-C-methyl-D-erythritol kinase [Burkholderiales bacterium]